MATPSILFARHVNAVANYAFRRTANWSAAEDVTSLVFLEARRQRRRVRFHQESILPWLIGVAHNVVRNMWRSGLRHRRALSRIRIEVAAAPDDDVAGRVDDERRMAQIRRLIDQLPAADRAVIELCAWARLSYAEATTRELRRLPRPRRPRWAMTVALAGALVLLSAAAAVGYGLITPQEHLAFRRCVTSRSPRRTRRLRGYRTRWANDFRRPNHSRTPPKAASIPPKRTAAPSRRSRS